MNTATQHDHDCEEYEIECASQLDRAGRFDTWKQCERCGRQRDRERTSVL